MNLRRQKLLIEPPTSAAPDIAFILIIFFLVCASTQPDNGRAQDIPRAEEEPEEPNQSQNIELSIGPSSILINGDPISESKFSPKLASLIDPSAAESDRIVVVQSSGDTPYARWITITSLIEQVGGIITLQVEETTTQVVQ